MLQKLGSRLLPLLVVSLMAAGCSSQPESKESDDGDLTSKSNITSMKKLGVTSEAFAEGATIPAKHTADGEDLSPPISWSDPPEGTKEFALICDDPDAPTAEPWVHWVIYKIPGEATGLPENILPEERPLQPAGVVQGRNSWDEGENIGYRGPAPPKGRPHRYFFRVYALDTELPGKAGMTKKGLLDEMKGHVLAEGQLMGKYER